MSRLTNKAPSYRHHKASDQAVVTLDGREIYLGKFNTEVSRREYDRHVGEWMTNGRQAEPGAHHRKRR